MSFEIKLVSVMNLGIITILQFKRPNRLNDTESPMEIIAWEERLNSVVEMDLKTRKSFQKQQQSFFRHKTCVGEVSVCAIFLRMYTESTCDNSICVWNIYVSVCVVSVSVRIIWWGWVVLVFVSYHYVSVISLREYYEVWSNSSILCRQHW